MAGHVYSLYADITSAHAVHMIAETLTKKPIEKSHGDQSHRVFESMTPSRYVAIGPAGRSAGYDV